MTRLTRVATTATPDSNHYFHARPYGKDGEASLLRDVLALANTRADGPRYLVVGVEILTDGTRRSAGLDAAELSVSPRALELVSRFVEPVLQLRQESVLVNGKTAAVIEIDGCYDQPYMARSDHSRHLRRGDAFGLVNGKPMKLGRAPLQAMFEAHFKDSVSADRIEIGFPGDIIHTNLKLPVLDLEKLPSAQAAAKLKNVVNILMNSRGTGSTSVMARLTHARLFGPDSEYQEKSAPELLDEMKEVAKTYSEHDRHYLFEIAAQQMQLVVLNKGDEPLKNASITLVLPRHEEFFVADELPRLEVDGKFVERGMFEADAYPRVTVRDNAIHVSVAAGDIAAGAPVPVFATPLRLAAGSALAGRRIGIRYSLSASNLRLPATGKLRLLFQAASAGSVTPLRDSDRQAGAR